LGAWLLLRVFLARIGHDESQYVAGADPAPRCSRDRLALTVSPKVM